LFGGGGNDKLEGDSLFSNNFGNDTLFGGSGNDVLSGGRGNDVLSGGIADDVLLGDAGADRMTGGSGFDRFDYNSQSDSGTGGFRDVITDFVEGTDIIDLFNIDANGTASGSPDFSFIDTNAFTGLGQVRETTQFGNTVIQINIFGSNAPDMEIELTGIHNLSASNFDL
jgi:Ca2+-binding RTX toxin-like protein